LLQASTGREAWRQVADWLRAAKYAVAFTGAGISTESGIPDFRSPGGVWTKYRQVLYQEFLSSAEARCEYWRQKCEAHREFAAAQPNMGHRVLAGWEQRGLIQGVITQNIDGLHQMAGNRRVLELHGTSREIECLRCHRRYPPEPWVRQFLGSQKAPECPECSGPLKHATISFGQTMPMEVLQQAERWSLQADLFLAIGSSLVVFPAAALPRAARVAGARLVIINRDPTPLDGGADLVLNTSIGETLGGIDELLSLDRQR
jgi:NAD-dependent deacetylase